MSNRAGWCLWWWFFSSFVFWFACVYQVLGLAAQAVHRGQVTWLDVAIFMSFPGMISALVGLCVACLLDGVYRAWTRRGERVNADESC